jgi:transmembrane sensor
VNRRLRSDPLEQLDPVAREATRWFVALHEDPSDTSQRLAFEAWRSANAENGAAYDRLQRLWGASGHLPSLAQPESGLDRRTILRGAGGLALAGVMLAGTGRILIGPHPLADYATGAGERRTVALADGSSIDLSTRSAISLSFTSRERRIRLHDGEAWFKVARDPARPFIVESAGGTVTALGTAFAVASDDAGALVTVTEHSVRVRASGRSRDVHAGQSCRYGAEGPAVPKMSDATNLAWRQGRLVFISRPLGEVAAELDRWHAGKTWIMDDELAARPVTLMIDIREADQALIRLGSSLPMRITQITPLLTVVRSPN